jgi:hypothetical protein
LALPSEQPQTPLWWEQQPRPANSSKGAEGQSTSLGGWGVSTAKEVSDRSSAEARKIDFMMQSLVVFIGSIIGQCLIRVSSLLAWLHRVRY